MKKIILSIFLIGVIIFISPVRSSADASYPMTVDGALSYCFDHYGNTGSYVLMSCPDRRGDDGKAWGYWSFPSGTDSINVTSSYNLPVQNYVGGFFYNLRSYPSTGFGGGSFGGNIPVSGSSYLYDYLRSGYTVEASTLNINLNGNEYYVVPETVEKDGFFAFKDDYTMQFGTFCTENSTLISTDSTDNGYNIPYFSTDLYWFDFSIPFNGSTLTYRLSSSYYMKYYGQIQFLSNDNIIEGALSPYFTLYVQKSAQSYARGIRAITTNTPKKMTELMPVSFDNSTDYRSVNRLSLRQLCSALQETSPNLTLEDLFTEITVTAVSVTDHKTHFTKTLDYSSLSGTVTSEEVPADDGKDPDQTKDPDIINEYFNSMVGYMDGILYGTTFNPPSDKTNTVDMNKLSEISMPDVDLTAPVLEKEPLTWFGSFVEWWYSSPFGLVAIAALTFLIIRTIIW